MNNKHLTYQSLVGDLPSHQFLPGTDAFLAVVSKAFDAIIVLDDDPTGTQSVHDIPVLTEWAEAAIGSELDRNSKVFYILTNSRSLPAARAGMLGIQIAKNIKSASFSRDKRCLVISRSDSTLRGHYPLEVDALTEVLQPAKPVHILAPAFFEGGRYTIDDVHYVRENDDMIPVAETPFASDKVFGFTSSHLKDWVAEKYGAKINANQVHALSLAELRTATPDDLIRKINSFQAHDVCIVNAACTEDFVQAMYCILQSDIDPMVRSAASIVATLVQQKPKLVTAKELNLNMSTGGVTVLGSYVPKSTSQLMHVLENTDLESIAIDIPALLDGTGPTYQSVARKIDQWIATKKDVIVYTSRQLISTTASEKNLDIGALVSKFLTDTISALTVTPRYVVGKGGITSSDLATKSLHIKRAMILGQMIAGVPVWKPSKESKFPDMPFIIYPGNVGNETGLTQVIHKLYKV